MRDLILGVVGVCLLALAAPLANAELVTIHIEGVIDTVEDDGYYLEDQIHVGDIITGWYTYDTDTPDTNPSGNVGDYEHSTSPYGVHLTVGGFTFMTDSTNVDFLLEIINDSTSGGVHDAYGIISYENMDIQSGATVDSISWWLRDDSAEALVNTSLSTTAPVLSDWGSRNDLTIYGERAGYRIRGYVTSAIPEPATIFLLVFGACASLRKRS